MTGDDFLALVASIEYKPGWKLEAEFLALDLSWHVTLSWDVEDAYGSGRTVTVQNKTMLQGVEQLDREFMVKYLFHQIVEAERHEAKEFFKVGGVRVYDPHKSAVEGSST